MRFNKLCLPLLVLFVLCLLTGCSFVERQAYRKEVTSTPGPLLASNVVTEATPFLTPAFTNLTTLEVTPAKVEVREIPVSTNFVWGPSILHTNLVPIPAVQSTIEAGAAALPFPWAGAGGIALGWLYTAYAAFRNKQAAKALVTGIEAGRAILQNTPEGRVLDHAIKDKLIEHQELAGVLNIVGKIVNKFTGDTVKAPLAQPATA